MPQDFSQTSQIFSAIAIFSGKSRIFLQRKISQRKISQRKIPLPKIPFSKISQRKIFFIALILASLFALVAPSYCAPKQPFNNIESMSVNMEGKEMFRLFARQDYKIWGLDYCANYSRDLQAESEGKKDIDSLKERLKWGGKRPLKEIQNYIDKHHKIRSLLSCFAMYDSPNYQNEIERIVRKYCKNCYCENCK